MSKTDLQGQGFDPRARTSVLKPYDQLASWTPSWTVQGPTNAQTQQGATGNSIGPGFSWSRRAQR
eukprot:13646340-Alexandrium_andersonii.AAC.1